MKSPDYTALLSSRICHDLISPVGAIVNGVDLLKEIAPPDLADEVGMINLSAERASDMLQYYRIAFGAAADTDEPISRSALHERTARMIASPRIAIHWSDETGPALPRPVARLMCLLLMCAKSITGMRGSLSVELAENAALPFTISITGDNTASSDVPLGALRGESVESPNPRHIEFSLAAMAAQDHGLGLDVETLGATVTIRVTATP